MDDDVQTIEYDGRTWRMRPMTTRDYIAMRRSEDDEVAYLEAVCRAVIEGPDPMDLPPVVTAGLANAWMEAQTKAALPPETA